MIIKHEYIVTTDEKKIYDIERVHQRRKEQCSYEIGKLISREFDYKEIEKPPHLHSEDTRYKLEIEAFPMDKWIEFKSQLTSAIGYDFVLMKNVVDIFHNLESFGKPVDKKEQQP
jgi:hypothetical protein